MGYIPYCNNIMYILDTIRTSLKIESRKGKKELTTQKKIDKQDNAYKQIMT